MAHGMHGRMVEQERAGQQAGHAAAVLFWGPGSSPSSLCVVPFDVSGLHRFHQLSLCFAQVLSSETLLMLACCLTLLFFLLWYCTAAHACMIQIFATLVSTDHSPTCGWAQLRKCGSCAFPKQGTFLHACRAYGAGPAL